ncbi:MAG: CDP-diacylglycerol--glycerol-3-phosphate 3-phosphatidyltransferase [Acidobacteria bacterium]|nr:CDP-diacylglycerol--glycerol-3-phosphate 3-phosphatidyltransferase [Acidobacteriota bacterium]
MTLPNILTLARILAIPFFAIALWYGHHAQACIIFVAAGLTDLLDGLIARTWNMGSELGAILDPAADKLLMTTAFVLMAWPRDHYVAPVPVWVAILAISRDVVISVFAFTNLARGGSLRGVPSMLGKVTTATQLVALSLGLLMNAQGPQAWQRWFNPWMYYLVAALVLGSGIHYFLRTHRQERPV